MEDDMSNPAKETKPCPADGSEDLICILGHIFQKSVHGLLFWGMCTKHELPYQNLSRERKMK